MTKSTSMYPARTVAERLAEQKKRSKKHAELAAAYRERTGKLYGPILFVDYLPEPDAERVAQGLAEREARRQGRLAGLLKLCLSPTFLRSRGRSTRVP